jgi:hypothetical protein
LQGKEWSFDHSDYIGLLSKPARFHEKPLAETEAIGGPKITAGLSAFIDYLAEIA